MDRLIAPSLLLAAAALGLGVFLPVVEVSSLAIFANRFSIAEAAWQLILEGEYLLGVAVTAFSAVFPLGKICAAALLYRRFAAGGRIDARWIAWLEFFGRWSCGDVLIAAMAIIVTKSTGIADARLEIGMWFFAASVLLTAVAVHRLKRRVAAGDLVGAALPRRADAGR